jgi:hypothetical protein
VANGQLRRVGKGFGIHQKEVHDDTTNNFRYRQSQIDRFLHVLEAIVVRMS